MRVILCIVALAFFACGDDDAAVPDAAVPDAAVPDAAVPDAAVPDAAVPDAGTRDSGAMDAAGGDAGPLGMTCEGECAVTNLEAIFGVTTEVLDVAYFGFNLDDTLRIEAYGGATAGCPEMDTPSPAQALLIAALPVPTDRSIVPLTVALFDFGGTFSADPVIRSSAAELRAVAVLLTPLETAFVRVDFEASFDGGGTLEGAIFATHCVSMDE